MEQKSYEFGQYSWRARLPSILLRLFCGVLLLVFVFDCIHGPDEIERSRSMGIVLFLTVAYLNFEILKQDIRIFFTQPTDIAGTPLLIITAIVGFYSVYLNA